MTQGELEKIPLKTGKIFSDLELRIMTDIVRRIKENGFSTASADWQITRLQQLGKSDREIKQWIQDALNASDEEMKRIFSDDVYEQYYSHSRAYKTAGLKQVPFEENTVLQQTITAVMQQISGEYQNLAGSMGFALRGADGHIQYAPLTEYYRSTLDNAIMDIHSGAFSYQQVLNRTINQMTASGVRWVDYDSGHHNRIDVAARRAVMTGFRQVQGKINEQVAAELGTGRYEVTYHVGARPSHQPWQGRVWTMQQLHDMCGLGTVTGLHGANCYHDYNPFPRGAVRTYTDEQLDRMNAEENMPKDYNGKEYTTYEALQQQRKMETSMRATRQKIKLLQEGGATDEEVILQKAKYQGQMQTYKDFSEKMKLPEQKQRIMQDGLRGRFTPTKAEHANLQKLEQDKIHFQERKVRYSKFSERFTEFNNGQKDTITARRIMNNLNKSEIGKETVAYILDHPELNIQMCYNIDHAPGVRGYQDKNSIVIYASETQTVQNTAETVVHEITHHRYDIGDSQWAECVCFAQEMKHRTGKSKLTGSDLKDIIKTVKELYPDMPWR